MIVFYQMLDRDDQDLIGMLDILNSHDPCISFFLESNHHQVLMTQEAPENALNVRYELDEELQEGRVTFHTIELFMVTIKDNMVNEVLKKPQRLN
ncbi:hypothetical protein [Fodinibius sp.]|uniref:hypothetical protein n=1 Tax=Fodinibius sp. TaxID=1872440 RepID=UPI002ACDD6E5|nr:hypothetical protein [Fodinibius sp.]MDZ7660736.1 hypothetical protein [Fodinibius sp.]